MTTSLLASQPIGIFDSGSGGLTVTKSIAAALPNEQIIYFGDTAHAPWGDKSTAAIQGYALKICEVLLQHHCKLILIACHTASALAFELVREYVGSRAIVMNVVDPVIEHLSLHYSGHKVGLIGTKQTVRSNIYTKKIDERALNIDLAALATPVLVPLIEEGFAHTQIAALMVAEYLKQPILDNIQAIILGCTHYPLIKAHIDDFYAGRVKIIDASNIIAHLLTDVLAEHRLLNTGSSSKRIFYISDYNEFFSQTAKIFFPGEIQVEHYPLWD